MPAAAGLSVNVRGLKRMQKRLGTEYRVRMLVDGERVVTVTVDPQGRVRDRR